MNTPAITLTASGLRVHADGSTLLDTVDMHVQAGEMLGIVGPNGAGKSTLLKVLAGVRAPDAGEVLLGDKALAAISASERARILAYLEQRPFVHWPLTVAQVVNLGRLAHGTDTSAHARHVIDSVLDATACTALQTRTFHTLSEGEKVRVHLARALAGEPRIVLADEPTAALDPWHQLQVLELLRAEAARGTGIALVVHDLQLAARFCDRLLVLDRGRVVAFGAPRAVLTPGLACRRLARRCNDRLCYTQHRNQQKDAVMAIWKRTATLEQLNELCKGTMCEHVGMLITEVGADYIKGTLPVDARTQQHMGIIHGGASVVLAETIGSIGSGLCCPDGHYIVGLDINANHVRPGKPPYVTGTARPLHIGTTTMVWDIRIHDIDGKLVCVSRLTCAVLKNKS